MAAGYFYLWIRLYFFFLCKWLIMFIVHQTFINAWSWGGVWMSNWLDITGLLDPIFQFFPSLCQGNFRTIWAQSRSSQPREGGVHKSPDVTVFLRSPVLITITNQSNLNASVFADCETDSITRRLLILNPIIQHPKIEVNNVIHEEKNKQTLILGLFSFFLAGKKVVIMHKSQPTLDGNSTNGKG